MSEIVNLRRARKERARKEKSARAEANRAKHGVPKPARDLAKARLKKENSIIDAHKLADPDKN